jgi:hypothetical protein
MVLSEFQASGKDEGWGPPRNGGSSIEPGPLLINII